MMEKAAGGVEAFYIYVTSRYIRDLLRWNKKPGVPGRGGYYIFIITLMQ